MTEGDRLLLDAALADGARAAAWDEWSKGRDLRVLREGEFALLPAVRANLRRHGADAGPILEGVWRWSWVRNQMLLREGADAIAALRSAGIPAMAMKGLAILATCLDDLGSRVMYDADVLVPEEHAADAEQALAAAGWKVGTVPPPALRPFLHAAIRRRGSGAIDLHWKPVQCDVPRAAVAGLWGRARRARIAGALTLVPAPEDTFVLSCLHRGFPDPASTLRWALDAASVAPKLDWSRAAEVARQWGFPALVSDALTWLRENLEIGPGAAPLAAAPAERRLVRFLGSHARRGRGAATILRDHWTIFRNIAVARGRPGGPVAFWRYLREDHAYRSKAGGLGHFVRTAARRLLLPPLPRNPLSP